MHPATAGDEARRQLVVTNSAAWLPFSFLDDQGEPKGLLIDLWRRFGEKNNVEITFKLVDTRDSLELIRTGGADVQGGLVEKKEDAETLLLSDTILRVKTMLYVPVDWTVSHLSDLGETPVGVVESTFVEEFLTSYFPDTKLKLYANSEVMVRAAVNGEISAFVTDYPTGYYELIAMDSLDRFKADQIIFTGGIHAAVAKGSESLLEYVNSGFSKISAEDIKRLRSRWFVPPEPPRPWILPAALAFLTSVVMLAFGAHYLSMRRAVRNKTEELSALVENLKTANVELDRMARIDPLTGVPNRHHLYQCAAIEIERAKRYRRPLSLVLFDLDHLKSANDSYGHMTGDKMLRTVAEVVRDRLREHDVVARIGGDEFIVLLPETGLQDAVHLTDRILKCVRKTSLSIRDTVVPLSFSAGVAEYRAPDTVEQWISRADTELYRSKTEGRAQVSGIA